MLFWKFNSFKQLINRQTHNIYKLDPPSSCTLGLASTYPTENQS